MCLEDLWYGYFIFTNLKQVNNMSTKKYKDALEILIYQKPVDKSVFHRVKNALAKRGVVIEQSKEIDRWLVSKSTEAVTFSDGTMLMHSRVSASGFFEELIHYGQIKSGRADVCNEINNLLLEIEAKERLIKHKKAYRITDFEIVILTDILDKYKIQLTILKQEAEGYV